MKPEILVTEPTMIPMTDDDQHHRIMMSSSAFHLAAFRKLDAKSETGGQRKKCERLSIFDK
jgi:hypothetical protein